MTLIIDLAGVKGRNAHEVLTNQYGSYHYIGEESRKRNLLGSPLSDIPDREGAKGELWQAIKVIYADNFREKHDHSIRELRKASRILEGLRQVAMNNVLVHPSTPVAAKAIAAAVGWYKEKGVGFLILCKCCYILLHDENVGEAHLCKSCAYGGEDYDPGFAKELEASISHFCGDCEKRLHSLSNQVGGYCDECGLK